MTNSSHKVVLEYGQNRYLRRVVRWSFYIVAVALVLLVVLLLYQGRRPSPTYLATQAYSEARLLARSVRDYKGATGSWPRTIEDTAFRGSGRFTWAYLGAKGTDLGVIAYCTTGWEGQVLVYVGDDLTVKSESYQPWVQSMLPQLRELSDFPGLPSSTQPTITLSDDPIAAALLRSSAVKRYLSSLDSKWSYLRDDIVDGGIIVAVGEDREDHFTRGLTVKVMDDGSVFILTTQVDGEEVWKRD